MLPYSAKYWLLAGAAAALSAAGFGLFGAATAQVASPHNLLTPGAATEQVCVFCHVPASDPNQAQEPSWVSDPGPTGRLYRTIDTLNSSLDLASSQLGATSMVCMSCHDGAQAPLISAIDPGSRDSHPTGVPYGGNNAEELLDGDRRRAVMDFAVPESAVIRGQTVWWVEADTGVGRQKQDLFLGSRDNGMPYVECATCHDPHGTTNPAMLRVSNSGDQICMTCHLF